MGTTATTTATELGRIAGSAADPWACADLRLAADLIRAARADGREPERDAYAISDEMAALLADAEAAGATAAEMRELRAAYSAAAHEAEDDAILAAAE